MNRKDICKNIIQSIYEYITSPDKLEPHREKIISYANGNFLSTM